MFLLLAVLRMGWIAQFLSTAVVTGFLAGAAVDVVIGELPKLTGTSADGDSAWRELGSWVRSLGDISATTLAVGAVALAVILGLRFAAPSVPGALVLEGEVPRGLPSPQLPDSDIRQRAPLGDRHRRDHEAGALVERVDHRVARTHLVAAARVVPAYALAEQFVAGGQPGGRGTVLRRPHLAGGSGQSGHRIGGRAARTVCRVVHATPPLDLEPVFYDTYTHSNMQGSRHEEGLTRHPASNLAT